MMSQQAALDHARDLISKGMSVDDANIEIIRMIRFFETYADELTKAVEQNPEAYAEKVKADPRGTARKITLALSVGECGDRAGGKKNMPLVRYPSDVPRHPRVLRRRQPTRRRGGGMSTLQPLFAWHNLTDDEVWVELERLDPVLAQRLRLAIENAESEIEERLNEESTTAQDDAIDTERTNIGIALYRVCDARNYEPPDFLAKTFERLQKGVSV